MRIVEIHTHETIDLQIYISRCTTSGHRLDSLAQGNGLLAQQTTAARIENESGGFMVAERRSWYVGSDLALECCFDRFGFAPIRNATQNAFGFQDLVNRHADGLSGNLSQGIKPALTHLLFAASLVELHDLVNIFGFEVRRRVIKRQVRVLADTRTAANRYACLPIARTLD